MKFTIKKIELPLAVEWKISRNSSNSKTNLIIGTDVKSNILGEVAPNIRYGEDADRVINQFYSYFSDEFESVDEVRKRLATDGIYHSLKFGMDQVLSRIEMREKAMTFQEFFELPPPRPCRTSFSIPIMEPGKIKEFLEPLSAFKSLKIKVSQDNALDLVSEVAKYTHSTLRIDANEGWSDLDQFLRFQERIRHFPIEFIEQPFPAQMQEEYRNLYNQSAFPIMADESIEDEADFRQLSQMFHMVNIKLMKAGTIQNAINLMYQAHQSRMKVMLGCMIETSLAISTAIRLGGLADFYDLDGFLLLQKDPFDLVRAEGDVLYLN